MKKTKMRVARRPYHKMSPDLIAEFALGVRNGVFVNHPAKFTTTPMTRSAFEVIIQVYQDKRSAYNHGGLNQKGPYKETYAELMKAIDACADMVDKIPNLTASTVMDAGFTPIKETRSKKHVPDSSKAIVKLKRGKASGVIHAVCSKVPDGELYHAIVALAPLKAAITDNTILEIENRADVLLYDQSMQRSKVYKGLTPAKVYYFYFYIVNARGVSHLTEVKSIMCA